MKVPFFPGVMVAVDDGRSPLWFGQVVRTGLFSGSPVLVAVTDPWENPARFRGQRIVVAWRDLQLVFRARWSR